MSTEVMSALSSTESFEEKVFDLNCKKYTLFIEFIRFTLIHKQNMAIAINLWPTYGPMLYNNMCWF